MDDTQKPSRLRSVNEALRPITPTKRHSPKTSSPTPSPKKRPRLVIAPCPICRTRMSTLMLPYHVDRCKPRRIKTPKPVPEPPTLHFFFKAPLITATFSHTPPPQQHSHTFTATVNLRSFIPPTILQLHAITPPPHPIPQLPKHTPAARLPLSLLKSALQKSVRRNRPWPALRIAIVLLRRHVPFELLRRLTIIILEDAVLHPAYSSLVFLLAASSKHHILSFAEILHLLQVVYDVAAVTVSDPLPDLLHENNTPTDNHPDLITALHVRASYGGMQFDTNLLHRAAAVWINRSSTPNWRSRFHVYDHETTTHQVTPHRISPWLQADDPVLRPGDIPLEAWDFHCCAVADDIVAEITKGNLKGKVPRFEKLSRARDIAGVFKGLMWRFWSGVTHKKPLKSVDSHERKGDQVCVYDVVPSVVADADSEEERVWKEELCPPVTEWCKTYRKRYGL